MLEKEEQFNKENSEILQNLNQKVNELEQKIMH